MNKYVKSTTHEMNEFYSWAQNKNSSKRNVLSSNFKFIIFLSFRFESHNNYKSFFQNSLFFEQKVSFFLSASYFFYYTHGKVMNNFVYYQLRLRLPRLFAWWGVACSRCNIMTVSLLTRFKTLIIAGVIFESNFETFFIFMTSITTIFFGGKI